MKNSRPDENESERDLGKYREEPPNLDSIEARVNSIVSAAEDVFAAIKVFKLLYDSKHEPHAQSLSIDEAKSRAQSEINFLKITHDEANLARFLFKQGSSLPQIQAKLGYCRLSLYWAILGKK